MNILNENTYSTIWKHLDDLDPAAALVVTIIHLGKFFSEKGDKDLFMQYNISQDEFEALFIIGASTECRPTDIMTHSVMQPAKITRILDKLDKKGLIKRQPLQGDRRSYSLYMTNKGKACLSSAKIAFKKRTAPLLEGLGPSTVKVLNNALRQLVLTLGDVS